jgi:hypothetical protein
MLENARVLAIGKILIAILWIVSGSAMLAEGESTLLQAGRLTFLLTAAAHVVECGIFFRTLNQRTLNKKEPNVIRGLGENIVLTLLFGVLHYATLKLEAQSESEGEPSPRMPANS